MRPCKICSHPQRDKINKLLIRGKFRTVSQQFGADFSRWSVGRHLLRHLQVGADIARRNQLVEQGVDFHQELRELMTDAKTLLAAAKEWLRDPENPEKLTVEPRDSEITVVYLDYRDCTGSAENPVPKKKRAKLDTLLRRAEASNIETVSVEWKQADNRQLFLSAIDTLNRQLKLYGDAAGVFQKPRENEETLNNICQVIRDAAAAGENSDAIVSTAAEMYKINKNIILRHYNLNFAPVETASEFNN